MKPRMLCVHARMMWQLCDHACDGAGLQDCNLVLYSVPALAKNGATSAAALWGSGTYNQGTAPCSAVVSSAGGGSLAVLDATGVLLFLAPSGNTAPDPAILQHRFNALQTGELAVLLSAAQQWHAWRGALRHKDDPPSIIGRRSLPKLRAACRSCKCQGPLGCMRLHASLSQRFCPSF